MKTPDFLTEQELEDLLKSALAGRYGVRDALLISLGYHHCLRVSGILELRLTDVENDFIKVQRKKDSEHTTQPLTSAVGRPWLDEKKLLRRYLDWRKAHPNAASNRLFLGPERVYNAPAGLQHRPQCRLEGRDRRVEGQDPTSSSIRASRTSYSVVCR